MAVTRGAKRKAELEGGPVANTASNALGPATKEVIDLSSSGDEEWVASGDEEWLETMTRGSGRGQKKRRTRPVKAKPVQKQESKEGGREGQMEADKQGGEICGICLSEEVTEQGKLDCCDHYFCFQCIVDWGKVESRCPMCKQRFATIVRPAIRGVPRSRRKTVRVPERNQVYEPSAEELMAMMAPQTDIMCHYCCDAVDEGDQQVCCRCQTAVAHTACAGFPGLSFVLGWTCRFCLHLNIEDEFNGLGELHPIINLFARNLPRRARRQERASASFLFTPFPASRSSRRAGSARRASGAASVAATLARRSLPSSAQFFLDALSASISEPAVSATPNPASSIAVAARHRSRGIPRVSSRPSGGRAAAGSSARRPILIPSEIINVEDDDEVPSNPVSNNDIARAWSLADQARSQMEAVRLVEVATNERMRPPRNAVSNPMRLPSSPSVAGTNSVVTSIPPLSAAPSDIRRVAGSAELCQGSGCPSEVRRGLSMRRGLPTFSIPADEENRLTMRNLGGAGLEGGEPMHVHPISEVRIPQLPEEGEFFSRPSINSSFDGPSSDRRQSYSSPDNEKKKEIMIVDLEESKEKAAAPDVDAGCSSRTMAQLRTPYCRQQSTEGAPLKDRIRELVKAELDPYLKNHQIGKEKFKEFARSVTHSLLDHHHLLLGAGEKCHHEWGDPGSSSCCTQGMKEEAKRRVEELISEHEALYT